jgi:hypothetical protein
MSDAGASALFPRMCRIRLRALKFVQYFLKQTLCMICGVPFVHAFANVSIELVPIYFHSFEICQLEKT